MQRETYRLFIESINFQSAISASGSARLGAENIFFYFSNITDRELLSEGTVYECEGFWQKYEIKGGVRRTQFVIENYSPKNVTEALVKSVLMRAYGVGKGTVDKFIKHYDDGLLEVLGDRKRLDEVVRTLDPKEHAMTRWRVLSMYREFEGVVSRTNSQLAELKFYIQLESKFGFSNRRSARAIYRILGADDAINRLVRNPWIGAGIADWNDADGMCKRVLQIRDDLTEAEVRAHPQRIEAAILQVNFELLKTGSTVFSKELFFDVVSKRLGSKSKLVYELAIEIARKKRLIFERPDGSVQPTGAFYGECALAHRLNLIQQTPSLIKPLKGFALDLKIKGAEERTGLTLSDDQRKAVAGALTHRLSLLQGGAGVGKTTVMRVLAETWKALDYGNSNIMMCCLTGKAALQLTRSVTPTSKGGDIALTMSRLLANLERLKRDAAYQSVLEPNMIREGEFFDLGLNNLRISGKTLLIIDEASMIDTVSLRNLVELLPPEVNILLVGDRFQLPPISWGQPFSDLVDLGGENIYHLTTVFRQPKGSSIPLISNQIKNDELPAISEWRGQTDGVHRSSASLEQITEQLVALNLKDWLILSSTNKGVLEVVGLFNFRREQTASPSKIIHHGCKLFVGAPVIFTQNRYKDGLMNGQFGVVASLDEGHAVQVQWDGEFEPRNLEPELWQFVELADAVTCHKAQGSSADVCIILLQDTSMETNAWLYTAVTRARRLVIFNIRPQLDFDKVIGNAIGRKTLRRTAFNESLSAFRKVNEK